MKRFVLILLAGMLATASGSLFAQKLKSGSLSALNGQTTVNIQYDYSQLKVGKLAQTDYIAKGITDRNKKKAGSGDTWAVAWETDKTARFQPMFEKNLNGKLDACGLKATENASDASYTLVVHINFIEPGFQSGVGMSKPALVNMVIDLVESGNPGTPIATIDYPKIQSVNMAGYDFDTGSRIQSCFDRAGDNVGKFICKTMKK
ncbi:MAG: hypothetical protein IH596_02570 [Bacteroidales bacterium]|nr:hypothetical protein [Bacteroidales bacterium]